MLNKYFSDKSPFVYDYFSSLLEAVKQKKRDFPQAIIFEGSNTVLQYLFSLELAKILNCEKDGNIDCNCTNCKWIKSFQHPAVNNVSQIHFKGQDDETKTVISTKQAKEIEKTLSFTSEFHRFFIFFSSREKDYKEGELADFKMLNYDEINFSIEPLQYNTFNPAALNALLKSIEEPPKNTTFIFLVKSKEDILSTIVSRCLVFKFSAPANKASYKDISEIASKFFTLKYENIYDVSDLFLDYLKETDLSFEKALNLCLLYLKDLALKNFDNEIYYKIEEKIDIINEAVKYFRAKISEKNVLEAMLIKIAKGNAK